MRLILFDLKNSFAKTGSETGEVEVEVEVEEAMEDKEESLVVEEDAEVADVEVEEESLALKI